MTAVAAHAQTPAQPYTVEVWARVLFDTQGRATEYALVDEAQYPAQFAANVKERVARAKIEPPRDAGEAATLRSGVRLDFQVTPSAEGGSVKIVGLSMGPLPTQRYYASYPKDVAKAGGWEGEVQALCTVGSEGRCTAIEVKALPGIPESVRRFAKASLEGWTFEPQQVNGKPIEGEYTLRLRLNTLDDAPEDFRRDKFQKILNSR
ncbi:MAG: energy transducer TonB [Pseudomonadota bacterium]